MTQKQQRQDSPMREPKPPFPVQHQDGVGLEQKLKPRPKFEAEAYRPAGKLDSKVALVSGGDSGIGRAVAVLFAREGASVAITYLPQEQPDADETRKAIESAGAKCLAVAGDLTDPAFCDDIVEQTVRHFGKLDILVANAAHQNRKPSLEDVTDEEFDTTFKTNIYSYFRLSRAALRHMKAGGVIIATSSETGILGSKRLPDYSATKGAINAFTKSLAMDLIPRSIRVNAVAPGLIATRLTTGIPSETRDWFNRLTPLGDGFGQPEDIADVIAFLASGDARFVTGVCVAVDGGMSLGLVRR